ncbi:MAG: NAD-dependent dehydratase, partial [Candidatus Eremiobacteraeota bacterium]|nr:NAD-dependent dehydratase [Candidatus Eremiobacteraeota bacterium]
TKLLDLGLQPHYLSGSSVDSMLDLAIKYKDGVDPSTIMPKHSWRQGAERKVPALA